MSNLESEKAKFMKDLDRQDLVAEEEAEKQRIKMLKENNLYDKQEQQKELEKQKDKLYGVQ